MRLLSALACLAFAAGALESQTGTPVPELAGLDRDVARLMNDAHIPGGAVAIVKDGRLVFARGYGVADLGTGEAFRPDSLCRVGSVSKTITALAILRLVETGRLNLNDRVFGDILTQLTPPPGSAPDARLNDITVRHLLHHTGGHGRDTGVDPLSTWFAIQAADVLRLPIPPGYPAMVRYAMGLPLDFAPGEKYSYSNYGFTVLARVVERVTGQVYEDFVRNEVLAPMGIRDMAVGKTLPEGRRPGEVRYYDYPRTLLAFSVLPNVRRLLPRPYANLELDAGDGSGRWIASAVDLARMAARVEGTRAPAFFAPETLKLMFEKPNPFTSSDASGGSRYGLGTGVIPNGDVFAWSHAGYYPGSIAGYQSFGTGYIFAFVFNATAPDVTAFLNDMYLVLDTLGNNQRSWPAHDLFPDYFPED